ncbi:MAG: hypothetical protein ACKO7R_04885 [Pseudanabaena sp.]
MKLLLDTHTFMWWHSDPEYISTLEPNVDLDEPCEIVLELIDSSVWRIYTKDKLLSAKLALLTLEPSNVRQLEAIAKALH